VEVVDQSHGETSKALQPLLEVADQSHENQISLMRKRARPNKIWWRLQISLMTKPDQSHEETSKAYQPLVEVADQSHEKSDPSHEETSNT
jgi:hypothetical protein